MQFDDSTLNFVITISTIGIAAVSFFNELANDRPDLIKFLKNVYLKLIIIAILSFVIWEASALKDENARTQTMSDVNAAKVERDSINNSNLHKIDSLNIKTISQINIGLKDVGLQIKRDSLSSSLRIITLQDSIKKININSTTDPQLTLKSIELENNKGILKTLKFLYLVQSAKAVDIEILSRTLVKQQGHYFPLINFGMDNRYLDNLSQNFVDTIKANLNDAITPDTLIFKVIENYKSTSGKRYQFTTLHFYAPKTNVFGTPGTKEMKVEYINLFKKYFPRF